MKVLILGDANSPHIIRWVNSLHNRGIELILFSFYGPDHGYYADIGFTDIHTLNLPSSERMNPHAYSKLKYLKAVKIVKNLISVTNPDIVHAHYASSYGLVGALSGFHPYIISVWGADIYIFPNISFLQKQLIKFNLSKSDRVLSTSKTMREEIKKYSSKEILITPFGIDIKRFSPTKVNSLYANDDIVIGTIKSLEKKYGTEYLIRAFNIVKENHKDKSIKLLIAGKGSEELKLKNLVKELDLENETTFTGYIPHDQTHIYHNMIDIFVSVSIDASESFGVAALEASACEKPVVVSNIGGLPEVVDDNKTGFVVEPRNYESLAVRLSELISDKNLRFGMGKAGRERVLEFYNWDDSVKIMLSIYEDLANKIKLSIK